MCSTDHQDQVVRPCLEFENKKCQIANPRRNTDAVTQRLSGVILHTLRKTSRKRQWYSESIPTEKRFNLWPNGEDDNW